MGGSCSLSVGPVGGYVSAGVQEHGPLSYGGGGLSIGSGAGCSAGPGIGW